MSGIGFEDAFTLYQNLNSKVKTARLYHLSITQSDLWILIWICLINLQMRWVSNVYERNSVMLYMAVRET